MTYAPVLFKVFGKRVLDSLDFARPRIRRRRVEAGSIVAGRERGEIHRKQVDEAAADAFTVDVRKVEGDRAQGWRCYRSDSARRPRLSPSQAPESPSPRSRCCRIVQNSADAQ